MNNEGIYGYLNESAVHLQAWVESERESKRQRKTIKNFPAFAFLDGYNSIEIAKRKQTEDVKVFNFFFVFLIDIKQIFSINN